MKTNYFFRVFVVLHQALNGFLKIPERVCCTTRCLTYSLLTWNWSQHWLSVRPTWVVRLSADLSFHGPYRQPRRRSRSPGSFAKPQPTLNHVNPFLTKRVWGHYQVAQPPTSAPSPPNLKPAVVACRDYIRYKTEQPLRGINVCLCTDHNLGRV